MLINESYTDSNGVAHWPGALVGSKLDYGIDWFVWLTNENDTFVSMMWDDLPAGLTSDFETNSENISYINIEANEPGSYCVSGIMESIENGHSQNLAVKIYLEVEDTC